MQMLGGQSVKWKRERKCRVLFPLPLPLGDRAVGPGSLWPQATEPAVPARLRKQTRGKYVEKTGREVGFLNSCGSLGI